MTRDAGRIASGYIAFFLLLVVLPFGLHGLPIVDQGVIVIMGVKSCGAGEGYCMLGGDCSLDKDFLFDPLGHCDGLKFAFTPEASFACCRYNTDPDEIDENLLNSLPVVDESELEDKIVTSSPASSMPSLNFDEFTDNTTPENEPPKQVNSEESLITDVEAIQFDGTTSSSVDNDESQDFDEEKETDESDRTVLVNVDASVAASPLSSEKDSSMTDESLKEEIENPTTASILEVMPFLRDSYNQRNTSQVDEKVVEDPETSTAEDAVPVTTEPIPSFRDTHNQRNASQVEETSTDSSDIDTVSSMEQIANSLLSDEGIDDITIYHNKANEASTSLPPIDDVEQTTVLGPESFTPRNTETTDPVEVVLGGRSGLDDNGLQSTVVPPSDETGHTGNIEAQESFTTVVNPYLDEDEYSDSDIDVDVDAVESFKSSAKFMTTTVEPSDAEESSKESSRCWFVDFREDVADASLCAGSLVSNDAVLTSAECVNRLQMASMGRVQAVIGGATSRRLIELTVHPNFWPDQIPRRYDIAMVRLDTAANIQCDPPQMVKDDEFLKDCLIENKLRQSEFIETTCQHQRSLDSILCSPKDALVQTGSPLVCGSHLMGVATRGAGEGHTQRFSALVPHIDWVENNLIPNYVR